MLFSPPVFKRDYVIDTRDTHARIQFRIKHIGKEWGPWGKFRRGFEDPLEITLADCGITEYLGKDERSLELIINLEGTR